MRRSFGIALLVGGILAGGTVGVIVGATSIPTIKACVERDGTMRYTATGACHTGEKKLSWNVVGPRGATGPQGPIGPQGPAGGSGGPVGVAFYEANLPDGSIIGHGTLGSLKLPAGTFILDWGFGATENAVVATCGLSVQGPVVTFTVPTTVTLTCDVTGNDPFSWQGAAIVATVATRLPAVQ